jgi:hypothetical protein
MANVPRSFIVGSALIAVTAHPTLAQRIAEPVAISRPSASTTFTPNIDRADRASGFASSGFGQFMASPAGRVLRVVAGAGMVAGGLVLRDDGKNTGGTVLAAAGLIPLSAGAFDLCYISPIFGGPIRGSDIRAAGGK